MSCTHSMPTSAPGWPRSNLRGPGPARTTRPWWRRRRDRRSPTTTGGGSSRPRRSVATSTSSPASSNSRAGRTTRSARPVTRRTRWSRTAPGPSDPALLHYRSGAFYAARAQRVPGSTAIRDVLQGLMALAAEPIAGGRHKVFGHPDLAIIPQTSTIASHLPRAVGLAIMVHRARRLGVTGEWPRDSVIVCSFGDASANHSTAVGAINTAAQRRYRGLPVPVLLRLRGQRLRHLGADPGGLDRAPRTAARPGLDYVYADGDDPVGAARLITDVVARVREHRRPAVPAPARPCGSSGTPAATPRSATAGRARSRPTTPATRCWPPPPC